ncbi:MAG: flagellar biosynthesis protein FliQ [Proteobacteria bacterium]|nr:flagellar biosynthesis protein FliQ [Pseudomonadota bacterium]
MTPLFVVDILREGIYVLLKISAPLLLVCLIIGVLISIFQALTQIQESTLSFVPKMIALFICLLLVLPFMAETLIRYTEQLYSYITHLPQ